MLIAQVNAPGEDNQRQWRAVSAKAADIQIIWLLPLQGETTKHQFTQGVALGYGLDGLSARFPDTPKQIER
ncbi:hypothetical protein C7Y71_003745 [Pseudoprevotella muciniphila]|uniref:Uncharacterized protein n=1 Tax=Pseudoprevotella muciniphila TaxID=2133944 RepID=A0A5P8E5C3_9BACT|nr:hypothetical protein [Pseudoprevotella muciniphila]QFQ12205.1 hypothetical protein C7Y71_003745 [Pseudoprevotella muciniphila]